MKVLSFVIPSYNCAHFLDKCITSMLCEEVLDQLEIIVVNDGSTDTTAEVAQKYCDQYPGIVRLISQENKGHGGALNTGCAAAVGKYTRVIDADDWVETENLPRFVEILRDCESDVVVTNYYTRDITTGEVKSWRCYPEEFGRNYTMAEAMVDVKAFDRGLTFHGITYNTKFYQEKGMKLSEHVFYEDQEFATVPCCFAKTILPLDLFLYNYRIGDVNQSVSDANQAKRIGHTETVLKRLISEYEKLMVPQEDAARDYFNMKAKVLLLGYINTAMLIIPDKKQGRALGDSMMELFREKMPIAYEMGVQQYKVYRLLNLLHVPKSLWDKFFYSRLYSILRHNHDFS
ncbi:MAG: glycosyltransferase family 2 protein [Oscillospiraceae bacterium]|nr:glycosyltransferase family 2 protein [Oscillospiraceae bacterium]